MKEENKIAKIILPIIIGIWLILLNLFGEFIRCFEGGCGNPSIINSSPIIVVLLSIFIYSFKKNIYLYSIITILMVLRLFLLTFDTIF